MPNADEAGRTGTTRPIAPPDLDALAAALPDAVILVDAEGILLWGNRAAEELFGLSSGEAVGRSGLEFLHPDDLPLAMVSLGTVQGKDRGSPIELRVRRPDDWVLVELVGAPFGDGVLLSLRDLTQRRRWEVAGDQVARYRSLMQNAASVTLLLRPDGVVTASSAGLTRLLGQDQEWLEGRPLADLVDPTDHGPLDAALEAVRRSGSDAPNTADLRLRRTDGSTVPFALTFSNLLEDPTVEGLVVTGHDITDRVEVETHLSEANSILAATLESTADGILVVDLEDRITSVNGRFLELWGFPPGVSYEGKPAVAIDGILSQLRDPDGFLAKIQELRNDPTAASRDLLEFIDGRIVERDSLPHRIAGEVVGRVWSFRDITVQHELQSELTHQAFHDSLTGLANQALFRDRVNHASERLRRSAGRLAVLFIDLDEFKTINDSLGHSAGDELLVVVSEKLQGCLRVGDTAARLGGDEFAVLIEDVGDGDDATAVADRILTVLREPIMIGAQSVTTTTSIGIAFGDGTVGSDEILRNADLAMYTAKADGKNCSRVFEAEMHLAALERLDLDANLRGAVRRGEMVVHYQPIWDMVSGDITAMEALVRWNHPGRGLLGPMSFIPFAEESGVIDEIGHHVLTTAIHEACRWAKLVGGEAPAISVNLSPRQLLDPDFPDRVELLLARHGLRPAQLILEITEGALMRDPVAAGASLQRLSRLGIRLAIDDFGTGYSSLAYLSRFPIDLLKIDRSFVNDMAPLPEWSLAQAIVQIAHGLGIAAIAEGVETAAQYDALAAMGCDLAQGYLLARPLETEAAADLVVEASARASSLQSGGG